MNNNGLLSTEPAVLISTISSFLLALFTLLAVFGLDLDEETRTAIVGLVGPLVTLILGFVIRSKVFAPATVARLEAEAAATGYVSAELTPPAG